MEARPSSSGKKSAIKITLTNGGGSNEGQTNSVHQTIVRAKDPCLGGGKLGKSKRGWHNLPPNVLHRIFDFALPSIHLPPTVHESWRKSAESYEVALTVRRRIWLSDLRFVCLDWKKAVDSHSFWPRYTLILDPSKSHQSSVSDLQSSRTTPSTPSYPTFFHRALRTTNHVCLPCRLNHPSRLGLYPAKRHITQYTPYFNRVSACDRHHSYCVTCLRGNQTLTIVNGHCLSGDSLLKYREVDFDSEGRRSFKVHNCYSCRQSALEYHIARGLMRAFRGYFINHTHQDIVHWLENLDLAQGYILDGDDTSKNTANQIIEDEWFNQHTRFPKLREIADRLVSHDTELVDIYIWSRDVEKPEAFLARCDTISRLMGMSPEEIGDFTQRLHRHTLDMYAEAKRYVSWKKATDNEDGEDEDDEYEDEDEDVEPYDREAFWTRICEEAVMRNFVRDRIRSGYWVHPSDELATYLERQTLPPSDQYTGTSKLPPSVQHRPDRAYDHQTTLQYSTLTLKPGLTLDYYPTEMQLQVLDLAFHQALVRYLSGPIARFRYDRQMSGWGIEEFDSAFPQAGARCTKHLLFYMKSTPECWGPFVEDLQQRHAVGNGDGHGHGRTAAKTTTNGQSRNGSGSKRRSPVIEVVEDQENNSTEDNPWDLQSENTEGRLSTEIETESEIELEDEAETEGESETEDDTGDVMPKSAPDQLGQTFGGNGNTMPDQSGEPQPPLTSKIEPSALQTQTQIVDEHPSTSLNNGKRKTPPPTSTNEPATKRRSPNASASANADAHTDGDNHDRLLTPHHHDNGDRASTPSSTVSTTTVSESEVDSSPSDPTDPMPVTPEDLPSNLIKPQQGQDQEQNQNSDQEQSKRAQETLPSMADHIPPKTAYNDLPHIPSCLHPLGPKTDQLIFDILQMELRPMRECGCKICVRAKNLHELVEAQAEVLGRVFEQGGDEGVRLALGL